MEPLSAFQPRAALTHGLPASQALAQPLGTILGQNKVITPYPISIRKGGRDAQATTA